METTLSPTDPGDKHRIFHSKKRRFCRFSAADQAGFGFRGSFPIGWIDFSGDRKIFLKNEAFADLALSLETVEVSVDIQIGLFYFCIKFTEMIVCAL